MSINPISVTPYQMQGDIDFTSLAKLPQVWRTAQQDADRRNALGLLGQGASPRGVAMRLAQAGDLQGAVTLANLERAPELTNAMKDYNFARGQGFTGTFVDFRGLGRGAARRDE